MSIQYPINKRGRIISGNDYVGWNVEIKSDDPADNGYLILIWPDETDQGYDGWVGSEEDLCDYFNENEWVVEWEA